MDSAAKEEAERAKAYQLSDEVVSRGVYIQDGFAQDPKMFQICDREREMIEKVLISAGQIKERCHRLAEQIFDDYKGKVVHVLVILTGAF